MTVHPSLRDRKSPRCHQEACVFCSSSMGNRSVYREAAARLGNHLATSGIALFYGSGRVGLMGVLADSV